MTSACRFMTVFVALLALPCAALLCGDEKSAKSRVPTKPEKGPSRASAAHIVISFADAGRKLPGVTRSKEEARKRAAEVLVRARNPATKFADLVNEFTDDPDGKGRGGKIGPFKAGQFRADFRALGDAVFGMEIGQVSDVVESPFGFHVLTRIAIVEYSAAHILIQFKGCERAPETVTRTKAEARKLATGILSKARKPDTDFAALAREHSEGPTSSRGGHLGVFGEGQMVPAFEKAIVTLRFGEVTGPVETPFGFHVLKRLPLGRIGARHILIQYKGSTRAKPEITRTKDEARALAEKILLDVRKEGADFAALAKKHSEGSSGPKGGDLGLFGKGQMAPAFEKAAFALRVGESSGLVETPFGFHIIRRTE